MAIVRAFPVAVSGGVGPANPNGSVTLLGWQLTETGGTTNLLVVVREINATGNIVATVEVQKGTSLDPAWFGPEGIKVETQVYVALSGGTGACDFFIR